VTGTKSSAPATPPKLLFSVPEGLRDQAAAGFLVAHGDPTPLLDLGFVPSEVGAAAGYPCASEK
jgi:hypothetical protein